MAQGAGRPPTWRDVVGALVSIEARLDGVLRVPRLPAVARAEIEALLGELRPLLRRTGR